MSIDVNALAKAGYRLTPATMGQKIQRGAWIPAKHLLYIAVKIAMAVQKGGARLIITMPPRHGKPLARTEPVLMADGTYKQLGAVIVGEEVITHEGRARKVLQVFEQGKLDVVSIQTRLGKNLIAALDHPILTDEGWLEAKNIKVGQSLAVISKPQIVPTHKSTFEEARLLGYFIGDGCCVTINKGKPQETVMARLICHESRELEDIRSVVDAMGFNIRHVNEGRYDINNGCRAWLRKVGIAGQNSHTKRVPKWLFRCSNEVIAHFIGAYFACDGSVGGHKRRMTVNPVFISCNHDLLLDVQSLLLRFGIRSNVKVNWHKGGYKKGSEEVRLEIQRRDDTERFAQIIPIPGIKQETLKNKMHEIFGNKRPQRRPFDDKGSYIDDQVTSVDFCGQVECRCLEVEDDHTFTCQNVVVHNSELLSINTPIWFLEKWPKKDVILSTYGADLSTDHARKVRDMMVDGNDILTTRLRADTKQVSRFMTTDGGGMRSIGVGGAITGRGGDLFLIDDYIKNAKESLSQTQRDDDWEWFRATAYTRLEPGGSMVILATRWNIDDLIGRVKTEFGDIFTEISIPAIALENDPLGRVPGEALWPERYSVEALEEIKRVLGTFWFEAQYQQRPLKSLTEVEISKNIQIVDILPEEYKLKAIRSWDFASTKDDGDWTVGLLMSKDRKHDIYYVHDLEHFQVTPRELQKRVKTCAEGDGFNIGVLIEQEPGSSGKIVIANYKEDVLPGYSVNGIRPTGPIEARSGPFLAACEAGKVCFVRGKWNKPFLDEIDTFPLGAHDDMVSAAAQAFNKLNKGKVGVVWGDNYARDEEYRASGSTEEARIITGVTW